MRRFGVDDLDELTLGATLLGTGGGGDPYIARLMVRQAIEDFGPVTIADPGELPDEALVATVAVVGAPTVIIEKIPSGTPVRLSGARTVGVHGQGAERDHARGGRRDEHAHPAGGRGRDGPAVRGRRRDAPRVPADRDDLLHPRGHLGLADEPGRREGQPDRLRDDHQSGRREAGPRLGDDARPCQRAGAVPDDDQAGD